MLLLNSSGSSQLFFVKPNGIRMMTWTNYPPHYDSWPVYHWETGVWVSVSAPVNCTILRFWTAELSNQCNLHQGLIWKIQIPQNPPQIMKIHCSCWGAVIICGCLTSYIVAKINYCWILSHHACWWTYFISDRSHVYWFSNGWFTILDGQLPFLFGHGRHGHCRHRTSVMA